MLIRAAMEDVERYGEMAYALALDPGRSSYPTYGDGVKTKADFLEAARRAVHGEASELLLFSLDGAVEGWISYFWLDEDRYLQIDSCNIRRGAERALTELMDRLEARFAGYAVYFGVPGENGEAVRFLPNHGFRCAERAWNCVLLFEGYAPGRSARHVERISRENFDRFRAVYHAPDDAYWNCDRIYETLEKWTIFVYSEGEAPAAAAFATGRGGHFEIFGMEFADGVFREGALCEVLTALLDECKRVGAKDMTCFCSAMERRVLRALGFRCVGEYILYETKL